MNISQIPQIPEAFKNTGIITFQTEYNSYQLDSTNHDIILLEGEFHIDSISRPVFIIQEQSKVNLTLDKSIDRAMIGIINQTDSSQDSMKVYFNGTPIDFTTTAIFIEHPKQEVNVPSVNKGSSPSKMNLKNF